MTLKEIMEKCSMLDVYEKRCISDEYNEFVLYNKEIDRWNEILVDILGPEIKPAGVRPSKDELRLTKDFGGIFDNQTLFKKEFGNFTVIAMFWPWQDNVHTTLKVALLKNKMLPFR